MLRVEQCPNRIAVQGSNVLEWDAKLRRRTGIQI